MARKSVPIFPLYEEVRRYASTMTREQFGNAVLYALDCYYDGTSQNEPDAITKLAATVLLEQAARYDRYRQQQRNNALKPNGSEVQPSAANGSEVQPSDPPNPYPYPCIKNICSFAIQLLNELTGSNYRTTTKKTQALISARVKEGFSQDDFEAVIRHKSKQWLNDEKMQEYLRPDTLFGTKFESYLNDARRRMPKEQAVVLAPLEDPFEAEMAAKGGGVDD